MRRHSWLSAATCIAACIAASTATAQTTGFIFSGDQAVSAADQRQFIRVGERLSAAQLRQRFPGYKISTIRSDCGGTCTVIESKDGSYIRIDYGGDRTYSFYRIYSDAENSRDSLGNTVGTSLSKAVGADSTKCDLGAATTCESVKIKGLSYVADGCEVQGPAIPACAKVGGFEISRLQQAPKS